MTRTSFLDLDVIQKKLDLPSSLIDLMDESVQLIIIEKAKRLGIEIEHFEINGIRIKKT